MLVRTDIPKLLTAGMKTEFMGAFAQAAADYLAVSSIIPSTKDQETYPWLGATSKMREWKAEREPKGLSEYYLTIINYDWEASIAVDKNALEDEQYGQIAIRVKELALEAKRFFDELVFGLIAQGDSTTGTGTFLNKTISCYDSKAFFATNHSEGASGTQSNKGTSELGASTLQTAITAMKKFKDDQGKPMYILPDLLICPPDLEFKARELLNSAYYPEEGTVTTKLATNVVKGIVNLLVTPYLSNTKNWFLFDTKKAVKPVILQMRRSPTFTDLVSGTESEFMRKQIFYGVDWRGFVGWGNWRTGYGAFI
jgi:phage major head subunit gpT-like protein